ncbi:hypothetical protein AYO21_00604 [Fonsecaea monophora]|uniref:aldehyde dehydrogenase (NAD(+)) n=1 Tax=Fonsecaea monophora TaxID=254056 RepID=A0A177FNH3_9EURO|nr:hypothetical protein AYO21_00604 [Fonsecaea monophora]OAG45256.1 hypothetical protein AYO21_00604 [Fonsecaea monophora]
MNGTTELDVFKNYCNTIDGKLRNTSAKRHGINPATGEALADVPVATKDDVDDSVEAARRAFKTWSKLPYEERKAAVESFASAIEQLGDSLTRLLTIEQGKPLVVARSELRAGVDRMRSAAKIHIVDEVVWEDERKQCILRYVPLGVCVGIVPWNFPVSLACQKIAPALMAGNTMIVKPSPFTPYCTLKIGELAQRFFPPGVLQVLSGDDQLGPWLTEHHGVDKISFTGSTATGKAIMRSASGTLKRVTLELGGNDASIVCPSVDIKEVAPKIATFSFVNSGQVCLAIKRVYVHESIYDEFLEAIVAYTKTLRSGDGLTEGVFVGPLQNDMQFQKAQGFLSNIQKDNLHVVTGDPTAVEKAGYFIKPTIVDRPYESSQIVQEEPFAPILPILSWTDEAEVIGRANNSKMGLGASVWTRDLEQADRIAGQLEAGSVWINSHMELNPMAPFGGHKQSGIGYEMGTQGLKLYCNTKTIFRPKSQP